MNHRICCGVLVLALVLWGCDTDQALPVADSAVADTSQVNQDLTADMLDAGDDATDLAQPDQAVDAAICAAGTQKSCQTTFPGPCAAGKQTCGASGWGPCVAQIKPGSQAEVCGSGKDEDCDAKTDGDDSDCQKCTPSGNQACTTKSPGICAAGNQTCTLSKGSWAWGECVASVKPGSQAEVCGSGKDEDCDAKTDGDDSDCQKCTPSSTQACTSASPGICAAGSQACALSQGSWGWGACVPTVAVGSQAEVCGSGKDEDCDAKTDGDDSDCQKCTPKATQACTSAHPGVCAAGTQACALSQGSWSWGACAATIKPGSLTEVCDNNKDDDCDGKTDKADSDCPTCIDKLKNGSETDVDCGGAVCPACAAGKVCKVAKDCASSLGCCGGKCTSLATAANCGACGTACGGVQSCKSGACACPATMVKQGATCEERFDGATPASGWSWTKPTHCPITGCSSSASGGSCKGCAKCPPTNVTACGNLGWKIVTSPKTGGGKALQVFSHATSGNCWQGDQVHKSYAVGRVVSSKNLSLKLYVSAAGAGATWQCGSISIAAYTAGKLVASAAYGDAVHGTHSSCAKAVLKGNKKDFTFDLSKELGGKSFDTLKLSLYKYSCVSGHWHTLTVDDIVIW